MCLVASPSLLINFMWEVRIRSIVLYEVGKVCRARQIGFSFSGGGANSRNLGKVFLPGSVLVHCMERL